MSALYASAHATGVHSHAAWALQTQLAAFLEKGWTEPDDGIWEVRGPRRHFTHSKVMAWVAIDRAVRTLEEWPDLGGPLEEWRVLRHEIFTEVCEKGFNTKIGAFTQYYGSDELDASVLMIPLVGFLPPSDPRVVSTVEAIEKTLVDEGLVLRYRTAPDGAVDGLVGRDQTVILSIDDVNLLDETSHAVIAAVLAAVEHWNRPTRIEEVLGIEHAIANKRVSVSVVCIPAGTSDQIGVGPRSTAEFRVIAR